MKDLKFAQNFSVMALNAQDSLRMTVSKKVALRCVAASIILEAYLDDKFKLVDDKLILEKDIINKENEMIYQDIVFNALFGKEKSISKGLSWWLNKASNLSSKVLKEIEKAIVDSLKGEDLIEEIPNLLGCDLLYDSASISAREYRSNMDEYLSITEGIRAEALEDGEMEDEAILILWLLRESACMKDFFSKSEIKLIEEKMNKVYSVNKIARELYRINIYHGMELAAKGFLSMKKNAMSTPTGTGVSFIFPIIERSQSIFIETEEWFANSKQRLDEVIKRLEAKKHSVIILREGSVPLLKIDNIIYEALPHAIQGRVAIHGVRLRKYLN